MGAYQRTIWPNGLPPLLRRAGDQRQYEALRAFYMDGLSSSVKVRGGTADPSGSSNRIANSPMLGQFRSVEIQARRIAMKMVMKLITALAVTAILVNSADAQTRRTKEVRIQPNNSLSRNSVSRNPVM